MSDEIREFQERALKEAPRLGPNDAFRFSCHRGLSCFTHCCADVNIALGPYDVLRLRSRLGLGSEEFLERYTIAPFTKDQRLPVRLLKMRDDEKKSCPFVGAEGCALYEDRPWPCRMYPVGSASPADGSGEEGFYFLLDEEPCEGFGGGPEMTVARWMEREGVKPYEEAGELLKSVTLHPKMMAGEPLSPEKMEMYHMAVYELDRFGRFIFESTFLDRFAVEPERLERMRAEEEELLRFSFEWLRFALFGDRTMPIRDEELERQREGGVLKKR